jgi:hypothetical protein
MLVAVMCHVIVFVRPHSPSAAERPVLLVACPAAGAQAHVLEAAVTNIVPFPLFLQKFTHLTRSLTCMNVQLVLEDGPGGTRKKAPGPQQ